MQLKNYEFYLYSKRQSWTNFVAHDIGLFIIIIIIRIIIYLLSKHIEQ